MNQYNESKLEGISDADLIAQTSMQYKAVSHLCASLKTVHDQTVEFVPNQSRMMLKMQCVRTAEIMMMLGDILNNMDAVDPEEDEWMAPTFDKANRIFGENILYS